MTGASVRAHFDRVAPRYETNRLGAWYLAQGRLVADHLEGRRFRVAVDVGCGTGWLLRELAGRGIVEEGIGLDLSDGMVAEARARGGGSLEYHRCAWPAVPPELRSRLERARPDLLVFVSSLHYLHDLDAALVSARRTLAPGGTIAILERAPERSLLTRFWGRAHALARDGAKFVSTPALHERLAAAGFEEVVAARYVERWLWKGKLITSMALSTARAPAA